MTDVPVRALSDGGAIPCVGLGTWPMDDAELADVVPLAIELGYRHFDSAVNYGNESGLGEGVRRSGIDRGELFLATKVPGRHHGYDLTRSSLDESLERLGLDYVDLYLIHWPNPEDGKYVDTWRAMIELQKAGKAKSIGVSNFKVHHLEVLREETGVLPAVNQIQLYPAVTQSTLRSFHEANAIVTESWSPLGLGANAAYYAGSLTFLDHPTLVELATAYGRTPAQIVVRWHVQLGLVPLPKSSNPRRLAENIAVFDFELSEDDMSRITRIDDGSATVAESDGYAEY